MDGLLLKNKNDGNGGDGIQDVGRDEADVVCVCVCGGWMDGDYGRVEIMAVKDTVF